MLLLEPLSPQVQTIVMRMGLNIEISKGICDFLSCSL